MIGGKGLMVKGTVLEDPPAVMTQMLAVPALAT